jgi:hypothetical protein
VTVKNAKLRFTKLRKKDSSADEQLFLFAAFFAGVFFLILTLSPGVKVGNISDASVEENFPTFRCAL